MEKICICICTFNRPKGLNKCLSSLKRIEHPDGTEVEVIVIDNDSEGSAQPVVDRLSLELPWPLNYVCETKRGIPCARNRAIDETVATKGDYLIFIDDDEWVEPSWLSHLYTYGLRQGGQVIVSGAVQSELPQGTPAYFHSFFNKNKTSTGTTMSSCATDNVLIPVGLIQSIGLRFDESQPFAGGTDTVFFCHATRAGAVIFKCQEALVHEDIPPNRLTMNWLARRKYRAGVGTAWRKQFDGRSRLRIVLSSTFHIAVQAVKAVFFLLVGRKVEWRMAWLKLCRSAGVFSGAFGAKVDSYRVVDGQ